MGQKVHPLGFRLGITEQHRSQWFATGNSYARYILEDHLIRKYLKQNFPDAGIVSIEIDRKMDQIEIGICAARPRVLLNTSTKSLETIRPDLTKELQNIKTGSSLDYPLSRKLCVGANIEPSTVSFHVTKLENPNTSAAFIATFLVEQLEKRVPFRRAMKTALQRGERAGVKGLKIQVSGRLNGGEIARSEWVRKGRVPLQTLRANFQYSAQTAKTIYGLLGIKVWVFEGLSDL
jgi:small subunit ribosomal protein S3|uniref:Small ribosomal subunit protein uS3c n=2 Tax=Botryococcus braunii TaxID=38881 RepID=A0A097KQC4_BOTBR|nr:ribosomal protein S3 [Botryococcus braunii]AIT95370.1 ribosomal protein S3 [Botryococcus braunii]CZT54113.1 Ribosomal protein S3 [Botryococcus braunii Showa]